MSQWESECPYDNVWLKISTTGTTKLFINCVYINDKTNFETILIYLDLFIDIINRREPNANYIILGDFNLSCIEWYFDGIKCNAISHEGRMAAELLNTLTCTDLIQTNHIKNAYNRTLDLILTNKSNIKCKRTMGIVNEDPYHPSISIKFDSKEIKFMRTKSQTKLNFFKANYDAINNDSAKLDWSHLFNSLDINSAVDI